MGTSEERAERLRAGGRRLGHARRRVLEELGRHGGPVTAEALAEQVPDVHVSSVYRTLAVLEELGIVRHVHLAHGPARYELSESGRSDRLLVCEVCGRTLEVPAAVFADLIAALERDYDFVLDATHFALTGHCTSCQ